MNELAIFERDENGRTVFREEDRKISFIIPKNRSFLGIVGINKVEQDDYFNEDGFVYNRGESVRKWFIRVEEHSIWEPKLKNLAVLEETRWKYKDRWKQKHESQWKEITKRLKEESIGGLKHHSKGSDYIQFEYIEQDYHGYPETYRWFWVEEKPDNINQELCNEILEYEKIVAQTNRRIWLTRKVFLESVDRIYYDKKDITRRNVLHLVINGRDYLFILESDFTFGELCFPENEIKIIV